MKVFPIIAGLVLAGAIASVALAQGAAKDATNPSQSSAKDTTKPSKAASKDTAKVAVVNGKAIPKSRIDVLVKVQAAQGKPDNEQMRKAILDQLIAWELVVQEADRKGLSRSADVQAQLDIARQQIIFQAYFQDYFKSHPVKDDALHAEYDKAKGQRGDKEYKARHILVEKEAEAKDIIEQLKKGGKFEELAKQSKDTGSKDKGGELDWQPAATYVKPFGDALAKLEKGKSTETPVQTQFGFHVIRLDDVRNAQFPEFDAVKPQISQMIQRQEVERMMADLRAKAKIE
jgi:peptidyl-prolyl cis-trans isomerase C